QVGGPEMWQELAEVVLEGLSQQWLQLGMRGDNPPGERTPRLPEHRAPRAVVRSSISVPATRRSSSLASGQRRPCRAQAPQLVRLSNTGPNMLANRRAERIW